MLLFTEVEEHLPCPSLPCHPAGPAEALSTGADECRKQQFAAHPAQRQGMSCSSVFLRGCWAVAVQQPLQALCSALGVTEVHCDVLWGLFVNCCWDVGWCSRNWPAAMCCVCVQPLAAAGAGEWPLLVALLSLRCFFPLDPISFPQKK